MRSVLHGYAAGMIAALVCVAAPAYGAGWVAPVPGCEIVTAYGAVYNGKVHRGVDLKASAGTDVRTPAAGRVAFAGRVPADGGGTCGAVTVELADGLRVSLLPLSEVFVAEGDALAAGEVVGTVAGAGDDSTAVAHVHLGVRRGDTYLDPTGLLPVSADPAPVVGPVPPGTAPSAPPAGGSGGSVPVPAEVPVASAPQVQGAVASAQGEPLSTAEVPSGGRAADGVGHVVGAGVSAGVPAAESPGASAVLGARGGTGLQDTRAAHAHRQLLQGADVLPASALVVPRHTARASRSYATGVSMPAGNAAALAGVAVLATAAVCGVRARLAETHVEG